MRCAALSLAVLLLAACGAVAPTSGSDASAARSASPPAGYPSPTASSTRDAFLPGDCTYPATGGARTRPVHDTFQIAISVPPGWTLQDISGQESDFLMAAPTSYKYLPGTISVSAPWPADPNESPSAFLDRLVQGTTISVTAAAQACTVGSDRAAFLSFSTGATVGYMVLWFKFDDYYLLQLTGNGGVDQRAVQDAKGVLASVTYAHNVPPPGYSPPPTS
jgi:hypothetical protein